jgi:hypothetical protein
MKELTPVRLEDRRLSLAGITETPLPGGVSQPVGITARPTGNLWFPQATFGTDTVSSNRIGRSTPSGSVSVERPAASLCSSA